MNLTQRRAAAFKLLGDQKAIAETKIAMLITTMKQIEQRASIANGDNPLRELAHIKQKAQIAIKLATTQLPARLK